MGQILCNESLVNGDKRDHHLIAASLVDILVSLLPVLALVFAWSSRILFDPRATLRDAAAVVITSSICHRRLLLHLISHVLSNSSNLGLQTASIALVLAIMALKYESLTELFRLSQPTEKARLQLDLPPLMIPCRTAHTRLFPARHSFSYSYLFVGIPVGWTGRAGTILSTDYHCRSVQGDSRRTWFSVEAEDYLERGSHPDGLQGKLFEYLRGQGVMPEQYSHALLVTAPRFLGFSFNPVSFWYLYNETNVLQAMIVEVNNTFDERRMYFMERTAGSAPSSEESDGIFDYSWEKDFHVSPFNSRDGLYSMRATDPCTNVKTGNFKIDCNIVLKTADRKAKIVARVFSTDSAIDVMAMTQWQILVFVIRWWWVGLMTNPRILHEARTLWAKKLQVYYRPEVLKTSIGRQESHEEAELESYFRLLLERLVQCSQTKLLLSYTPAAGPRRGVLETIGASKFDLADHSQTEIEVRVMTPAFYSQFVRIRDNRKAFGKLCFDALDSEKLILVSDRAAFLKLLSGIEQRDSEIDKVSFRWRILGWLRGITVTDPSLFPVAMNCTGADDKHVYGLSQLDLFIMKNSNHVSKRRYCRIVTALFVSDRLALGWTKLLRFYGLVIWLALVYVATSSSQESLSSRFAGKSEHTFRATLGILGLHLWASASKLI